VFRFRRDVPPHLRDILDQKVLTESLGTKDEGDAFRRGLPVVARYQKLFDDAEAIHRQRASAQPVEVAQSSTKGGGLEEAMHATTATHTAAKVSPETLRCARKCCAAHYHCVVRFIPPRSRAR